MPTPSRNAQVPTTSITFRNCWPKKLFYVLGKLMLISVCFLIFLVCTIFVFFPLYVYKCIIVLLAKIFRPDLISIIAPRDICCGLDDVTKKTTYFIQTTVTFHGEPDIEHIRSTFQTRVMEERDAKDGNLLYEKFTYFMKLWLGYGFWSRESNFSLHEHIRFCEDSEQLLMCQPVITEQDFINVMGKLSARPLRQGMSPWEILIVRNFVHSKPKIHIGEETRNKEGSRFILICRMQHSICDGFCILKMLVTNLSGQPVPAISSSLTRKKTICSGILIGLSTLVLFTYYQLKQFVIDVDKNIWNISGPQTTGEWLVFRSEKIPLAGLKRISKARNVSLTALFNVGLGAGIRAFLEGTGQGDKIPEIMRATIPFPWKTHPLRGLVNCWSIGFFRIPIGPCFQQNLQIAEKSIRKFKKSPAAPVNFLLPHLVALFPVWFCKILGDTQLTTIAMTMFPGQKYPIQGFDRYWFEEAGSWLDMRGGFGISISFITSCGNLRMGVTVDKAIIPTQEQADYLAFCINQEFKNILNMDHVTENLELDDEKIV